MTDKTRSIDLANISLRDALDLAVLVEEEAKDRYEEFADQMELHHNPEAARFFRFMLAMTVRQALDASLRAETKAFEFFEAAAQMVQMEDVQDIFTELREEEREHQALVRQEIARLPPEGPARDDDDEIVAL